MLVVTFYTEIRNCQYLSTGANKDYTSTINDISSFQIVHLTPTGYKNDALFVTILNFTTRRRKSV